METNGAEIGATGRRLGIGALSRRPLFRPSADFTQGDIANSSRQCRASGKPAGVRPMPLTLSGKALAAGEDEPCFLAQDPRLAPCSSPHPSAK